MIRFDCTQAKDRLDSWLDGVGGLPQEEEQAVDAHLKECATCRALFQNEKHFWEALGGRVRELLQREQVAGGTPQVAKALGGKAPVKRAVKQKPLVINDGEWEHPFEGLEERAHGAHLQHHEGEWAQRWGQLASTKDNLQRQELIGEMRRIASHWMEHRLARYAGSRGVSKSLEDPMRAIARAVRARG